MIPPNRLTLTLCGASLAFVGTNIAAAQDSTPAGIMAEEKATSGTNDVTKEGFEAAVVEADTPADATEVNLVAGGVLAAGNARSLSLTAAANFRMRRDKSQLTAAAAMNYGQGAPQGEPVSRTVENYQARARYDYFLARHVAAFLAISARSDPFQGLTARLNVDPGFAYYFVDVDKHQLWAELGYDLQYDIRTDKALGDAEVAGDALDRTQARHSARLFVGYDNKLSEAVAFNAGAEYLQGLSPAEDKVTKKMNMQLNTQAGLTAKVSEDFSVASTIGVKFDNNPLPNVEKTDVVTALNLVYSVY